MLSTDSWGSIVAWSNRDATPGEWIGVPSRPSRPGSLSLVPKFVRRQRWGIYIRISWDYIVPYNASRPSRGLSHWDCMLYFSIDNGRPRHTYVWFHPRTRLEHIVQGPWTFALTYLLSELQVLGFLAIRTYNRSGTHVWCHWWITRFKRVLKQCFWALLTWLNSDP